MAGTEEDNEVRRESVAPPAVAVVDSNTAHEAAAANENEQNLGLRKSFKLYRKAVLWSVFLSTCIVMEGFDLTLINNLYAYGPFKEKFGELQPDGSYELTAAWQSGLSNGALCGQIMGLFANGIIADRFGYRKTLCGALAACACFIFIIFFSESLTQLLIGEILIGFPWGVFQTLTTTYAAEVCPTHLRAYLTTYVNLCWVIGQFLASGVLVGMQARDDKWGYKIPFALQWMWPIPLTIGIWLAPESPWWLVRAGRLDEAKHVLGRLTERNTELAFDADATVSMMVQTNEMEKEVQAGYGYADLFRGVNRRRTEIVCMAWVAQTLCGSQMFAYSTYFYQQAGLAESQSFNMSLGMYAIGAVGTLSSWFLMGSFGRRTLYLAGQWSMAALLFTIGCIAFAPESDTAANCKSPSSFSSSSTNSDKLSFPFPHPPPSSNLEYVLTCLSRGQGIRPPRLRLRLQQHRRPHLLLHRLRDQLDPPPHQVGHHGPQRLQRRQHRHQHHHPAHAQPHRLGLGRPRRLLLRRHRRPRRHLVLLPPPRAQGPHLRRARHALRAGCPRETV